MPDESEVKDEAQRPKGETGEEQATMTTATAPHQPDHPASRELHRHELAALATCFIFPLVSAWLLDVMRANLSRPSDGLVANTNLWIFLMLAELKPVSHILKLVQARTLHLQRVVAAESLPLHERPSRILELAKRLDMIEAQLAVSEQPTSPKDKGKQSQDTQNQGLDFSKPQIVAEVLNRIQPDMDSLNRALQQQENRRKKLSTSTDQRLRDLETRLAAMHSDVRRLRSRPADVGAPSSLPRPVHWIPSIITLPVQLLWSVIRFPMRTAAWCLRGLGRALR
jgi:hypothetical protein